MKPKELAELGVPQDCMGTAVEAIQVAFKKRIYEAKQKLKPSFRKVASAPEVYKDEATFSDLANAIIASRLKASEESDKWGTNPLAPTAPTATVGREGLRRQACSDEDGVRTACRRPGALMPDNHLGYGLPIGGVLATHNCVIPYAGAWTLPAA